MLVSRLLRSLLRFLSPGIIADDGGGGAAPAAAPAAEPAPAAPAAAPAPAAAVAPAPAPAAPADPFGGLKGALDAVSAPPTPAPSAAPAPGQARDPIGRFASPLQVAAGVAAPAPAAPAAPVVAAAAPVGPKPGELDLTPPEGMNERSQQRWAQLTERAKQVPEFERRATEATQALDSVRQMVSKAGLEPEEFSDLLETARLVKSASPQDAQAALQRLDAIRSDLAQRFSLDVAGVDPLAAHADLKADVDGMLMTRERALEIARLRSGNQQGQQVMQAQREQQQFQTTVQNAAASMERTLKAREGTPGHQEKLNYIGQHFKSPENLKRFVTTYEPHQWEAAVTWMYEHYTPPVAAPVPPPAPAVPQPLRPGVGRMGAPMRSGPVTPESSVASAFDRLGI